MDPLGIVVGQPLIEVDLQLIEARVELFAKRHLSLAQAEHQL